LVLEDEVDASRGDVIAAASHPVESADQFEVDNSAIKTTCRDCVGDAT